MKEREREKEREKGPEVMEKCPSRSCILDMKDSGI